MANNKTAAAPQVDFSRLPRHVAIILDGNGRWAKKRILNLSRSMIESASFMYLSKMFMIVRTSSGGRRQFSVEKA